MSAEFQNCKHCETPFIGKSGNLSEFCCAGCEYVYGLIQDEGFDQFYKIREQSIKPIGSVPIDSYKLAWVSELMDKAESSDSSLSSMDLDLDGASCVGCVWLIKKLFERKSGGNEIYIDLMNRQMRLEWETGCFDLTQFIQEIQQFGYLVSQPTLRRFSHSTFSVRVWLCGAFALNSAIFATPYFYTSEHAFLFDQLFEIFALLFAVLSFVVGGSYFIVRALEQLKGNIIGSDMPIALTLAFCYVAIEIR